MATAHPYHIPLEMYKEQRQRIAKSIKEEVKDQDCCILLQGCTDIPRGHYSDCNFLFRQDSYFQYLFGYEVPDCYGAVFKDGKGIIFIPRLPQSCSVWMGLLPTAESVKINTGIDEVYFVDEIQKVLESKKVKSIHVLVGVNSDSGHKMKTATFPGIDKFKVVSDWLYEKLSKQRRIKTKHEIDLLRYNNKISSDAHVVVMQMCKPGLSQHQLESTFLHQIYYKGGMRQVSYTCICATGHHGAILHYPNNDKTVEDGSMALLDMGGEYHCYCSDITCSFPVNGKFTENQRIIYNSVLDAQFNVFKTMKPGVKWLDMHKLALRVMAMHLIEHGFFTNEATVDKIMEMYLMRLFQPHGLGHLYGLEVHDVAGFPKGEEPRSTDPDSKPLRTCCTLEPGMCLTVEPGIYFNQVLLEEAFANAEVRKYLNEKKCREFWNFGGVRIEDDVVVTENGIINITCCPRTVEEIEATMSGKPFKKEPSVYKNA